MTIQIGTKAGEITVNSENFSYNGKDKTIYCYNNSSLGQEVVCDAEYIYFIILKR
jgi:hypothetical protein